jgi:glycosyltransferase involved in cell wall biosynthesis
MGNHTPKPKQYRIGFIIEQALGHITHTQNLQDHIVKDLSIQAFWGLPSWKKSRNILELFPLYRSNWTIRAGLQSRRILAQLIKQVKLDALFFHTQVPAILAQDWLDRLPGVVSLDATPRQYDSLGSFYEHSSGSTWLENWKWRLNRDSFKKARHLTTWSAWAKQGLVDEYEVPAEKITVIPPGVTLSAWSNPNPRNGEKGLVKILFVGGNLERKGGLLLLEVFRTLKEEFNGVGRSNEEKKVLELHLVTRDRIPNETGIFVYNDMHPNSPALKTLYFDCDIFCLPTFGDCLPMALMEAGAAGLALVSTRVAAIPEIVLDGETGFAVQPKDRQSLMAALYKLINEPQQRLQMGKNALQHVAERYDAERNTRRLVEVLKSVVDQSSRQ